jgi:hypothetical protein
MDERYQQEAGFGEEQEELENDELEDEIVSDEIYEEDQEQEDSPEEEEDNVSETKQRDKAQVRISRLTKERYRAENKAKKYASELELMRQKNQMLSKLAIEQTNLNANARLEKAMAAQKAAYESGDAQAQADATFAISAATSDLQEINKEKDRFDYEDRVKQYQQPQQQYEQPDEEILKEWIEENNDWINPKSRKYDQELHTYIVNVDNALGNELKAKGGAHHVGSLEYFDLLENYKNAFLNQRSQAYNARQNTNQRRELNMKPARGGGSPVRNSSQSQHRSSRPTMLSESERAMLETVRHLGVTEEIFIKSIQDDIKKRREPERRGEI